MLRSHLRQTETKSLKMEFFKKKKKCIYQVSLMKIGLQTPTEERKKAQSPLINQ